MSRYNVGCAAQAACLLESAAFKPGNVNRYNDFHDLLLEDFLLSAVVIGKHMENAYKKTVGETVLAAVKSTLEITGTNTNLGIILLFSPLAKAYDKGNLRDNLKNVLAALTVEDSIKVYKAINMARAGGMGKVKKADLSAVPGISLYESMMLAKKRDSIAREYVTGYEITFDFGKPALESLVSSGCDFRKAVVQLSLQILSKVPDTLIARKNGIEKAVEISKKAAGILKEGGVFSRKGMMMISDFDKFLRSCKNSFNPGTTADLVAASIFVYFLEHGLHKWKSVRLKTV